jgi:hypothetical protein
VEGETAATHLPEKTTARTYILHRPLVSREVLYELFMTPLLGRDGPSQQAKLRSFEEAWHELPACTVTPNDAYIMTSFGLT